MRAGRAALAITALLLTGALSGCGGGSGTGGSPSPSPTAGGPSASSSAPTPSPTPTPSTTPSATPSATGSTSASPTVAGCRTRDLRGSLRGGDGALGSDYFTLVLTNAGTAPCALGGYGGVSFVDAHGRQIGAPAQRDASGNPVRLLVLQPGDSAGARLQVTVAANYDPATCRPRTARGLRVYPPNETAALLVAHRFDACASPDVQLLTVRPYGALR